MRKGAPVINRPILWPVSKKRRVGIMGGTFDPIHHGHLVCAEEARYQFELDEVVFIPAGQPWQKKGVTSAQDRLRMTEMAVASNPAFSVSRLEIDREGPTYTMDTLADLRALYGDEVELFFVTGSDAVMEILTWKDPQTVLSQAQFIAASRPGYDLNKLAKEGFGDRVRLMEIPALELSSTSIRERVREGRPVRYLVPLEVERYIVERKLYRH